MSPILSPATWLSLVIVGAMLLSILKRFLDRYWALRGLPGPPMYFLLWKLFTRKRSLPLSVHLLEIQEGMERLYAQRGIYRIWLAARPIVTIFHSDHVETILSSTVSLDKSWEYSLLHSWLGTGLLTSTGEKWRARRKILTSSFNFQILRNFVSIMNEESMTLVHKLGSPANKDWVDIRPLMSLCSLDIVSSSIMGVRIAAQNNSESQYVKALHNVGNCFNKRATNPWLWSDSAFHLSRLGKTFRENVKVLHDFTRKVIKEKKSSLLSTNENGIGVKDQRNTEHITNSKAKKVFMDLLLHLHVHERLLSEEDIAEEVDTFMFEGHDTVATGLSWAFYCIGLNPHVQEEITKELEEIFADDKDRSVTFEDLSKMKYLECTIKESMRIYPSIPLIGRKLVESVNIDGVTLPKGSNVHISIRGLHHNPEVFPNPKVFDPERFRLENSLKRHPFSFLPFSAGPRNCIGQKFAMMEEKIVISNVLRHFEITSFDEHDQLQIKSEIVLRPVGPLRVRFITRTT